jgi:hypothetical protein
MITPKAKKLMLDKFTIGSGVNTNDGSPKLWKELQTAGLVEPMPPLRIFKFAYSVTEAGKQFVAAQ